RPPTAPLFPYTTLFRSGRVAVAPLRAHRDLIATESPLPKPGGEKRLRPAVGPRGVEIAHPGLVGRIEHPVGLTLERRDLGVSGKDRKSTRLNSSHDQIS